MRHKRFPTSPGRRQRPLGFDHNPLRRRRPDRMERRTRVTASLAVLLMLPLTAWLGARSYAMNENAMRVEQTTREPVVATLTDGTPAGGLLAPGGGNTAGGFAAARWSAADGTSRAGYLRVGPGARAGSRVPIWIDGSGAAVGAPMGRPEVVRQAVGDGVSALAGGALLVLLGLGIVHWRLDRARMRSWDTEWAIVEPQWTADCP